MERLTATLSPLLAQGNPGNCSHQRPAKRTSLYKGTRSSTIQRTDVEQQSRNSYWKISEKLLLSLHSEVSTYSTTDSQTFPEEKGRCKADNIWYFVYGTELGHLQMRKLLSIATGRCMNHWSFQEHTDWMAYTRVGGSHFELQAASSFFEMPVFICNTSQSGYQGYKRNYSHQGNY